MADKLLNITITGQRETVARMQRYGVNVMAALMTKTQELTLRLQRHVVEDKLSGQVLNVRTGNLRRSIQQDVKQTGYVVRGRVYSSGDVKYAAIHEFGGQIKIPPRQWTLKLRTDRGGNLLRQSAITRMGPHSARAARLHEMGAVFAKTKGSRAHTMAVAREVSHEGYTVTMPERSFLRSSLADMRGDIVRELKEAAILSVRYSR